MIVNLRGLGQRVLLLGAAGFTLAGCASSPPVQPGMAVSHPDRSQGQEDYATSLTTPYYLRSADIIDVTVFREQGLSLDDVPIAAGGEISMPLLGSVQAAGLTPSQLAARLEELLNARYLREASVAVNVVSYASHQVTVEGAVEVPGVYSFGPGARLSGGLALAEGPMREADINEIAVFRQTSDGIAIAKFDYEAIRAGTMIDPILEPGDRIVVGTNGLSQFWQDLLKALPAFAIFTQI